MAVSVNRILLDDSTGLYYKSVEVLNDSIPVPESSENIVVNSLISDSDINTGSIAETQVPILTSKQQTVSVNNVLEENGGMEIKTELPPELNQPQIEDVPPPIQEVQAPKEPTAKNPVIPAVVPQKTSNKKWWIVGIIIIVAGIFIYLKFIKK
jgi:hypothetical protein